MTPPNQHDPSPGLRMPHTSDDHTPDKCGRSFSVAGRTTAILLLLSAVFAVALGMRLDTVLRTDVQHPLRGDAGEYYMYALNMQEFGVYSSSRGVLDGSPSGAAPQPDARRTPGYPLFLLPFVNRPVTAATLQPILILQAIMSALTVVVAFLLFRTFLSSSLSIAGALLTALSPHLIVANVYVLTEALFTLLMTGLAYCLVRVVNGKPEAWAVAAGLLLGASMLVRPTLTYLLLLLVPAWFAMLPRKQAAGTVALAFLSCFLIYGPWMLRNAVHVDADQRSTKALDSVHAGMYPNVMFEDDPETLGFPYRFDPSWHTRTEWGPVITEIADRLAREPQRHLSWYLGGKPMLFLSWDVLVGMGDVFTYPVYTSPYHTSRAYFATHQLMRWLHWPATFLAIVTLVFVWVPSVRDYLGRRRTNAVRIAALLVMYFLAVHVAGLPLPRYAIPLRPLLFGLALLGLQTIWYFGARRLGALSSPGPAPSPMRG